MVSTVHPCGWGQDHGLHSWWRGSNRPASSNSGARQPLPAAGLLHSLVYLLLPVLTVVPMRSTATAPSSPYTWHVTYAAVLVQPPRRPTCHAFGMHGVVCLQATAAHLSTVQRRALWGCCGPSHANTRLLSHTPGFPSLSVAAGTPLALCLATQPTGRPSAAAAVQQPKSSCWSHSSMREAVTPPLAGHPGHGPSNLPAGCSSGPLLDAPRQSWTCVSPPSSGVNSSL
jgi:hypothetical protein